MPGDLRPLKNALGHLASPDVGSRLRAALAVQAERELLRGFRESVDPWGNPWDAVARVSRRGGAGKPLMDTGQLRGSRVSQPTATGIEVSLTAPYASYQQFGTTRGRRPGRTARPRVAVRRLTQLGGIRPRPMLPIAARGRRGLGTWQQAFDRVTKRVMQQASRLGGR